MSKPKLPKVWVGFKNADQAIDGAYFKLPWRGFDGVTRFRLYAPVQKPKRCEWSKLDPVFRGQSDRFSFSCSKDKFTWDPPSKFCPYCGGKIKVTK